MPLLAIVALFVAVPIAELYVILQVGDAIGAVPTILLLAADSAIGAVLLRSQGRSVWRQFNATMASGRVPHRELIDGVGVVFGGALLLTPGFITDAVGLLLLLPPTRAVFRRVLVRRVGRRLGIRDARGGPVEGTAREHEPPRPGERGPRRPPPQGRIEP
jgi:UPF0716 protein FxsA